MFKVFKARGHSLHGGTRCAHNQISKHLESADELALYESQNGTDFYRIATYKYEDYPIMMGHNAYYYYEDILTFTGTPGYKYYIIAYCYAEDSTGYDQKAYTSAVKTAIS